MVFNGYIRYLNDYLEDYMNLYEIILRKFLNDYDLCDCFMIMLITKR